MPPQPIISGKTDNWSECLFWLSLLELEIYLEIFYEDLSFFYSS